MKKRSDKRLGSRQEEKARKREVEKLKREE